MTKIKIDDEIELRMLREKDRFILFNKVDENRLHLKRWLPWVDYTTGPDVYISVINQWQTDIDKEEGMELGIFYHDELVGMCGYNLLVKAQGRAQIGYWIGKEAEGKGIVRRSVGGLVDYGFDRLGLNRIEIICGEKNRKSRAIPETLGFYNESTMAEFEFLHDHYHHCVMYRLLRRDR